MMPSHSGLSIQLLGSFTIQVKGNTVENGHWRLRKAQTLVAMLALAPSQRRRREQVLDRLWPDLGPVAAARNLHQTLYVARQTLAGLGAGDDGLLAIRGGEIVLDDRGPVAVDVLQFERLAVAALASGVEAGLREAADLYGGDLLPDLPDADWLTTRRNELRETHREVLVKLGSTVGRRAPEEALAILTRALESDPLHEGAVRAQMVVLAGMGRRSEALARYERLVEDLLDAFGTDPDARTAGLFRELLTGSPPEERPHQPAEQSGNEDALGSLPSPLTSFIGRERELVDVERLIGRARLLTLIGAGGSGKTRLALEAAKNVRSGFVDGVWFIDLAGVGESLLVADAVAEVLGLDSGAASNRVQALVDQLRRRSLLLVLDNCEHLLVACAQLVVALLAGSSGVKVMATSREPLHVDGEYTFRVPSLTVPSPIGTDAPDLAELGLLPSVRLFVERAAQVRPGFALDPRNVHGVTELCRRLDGMPLALELAAARTAVLEPAEIVQRLGDALSILGAATNGVTRHQTLRSTLEWSHGLLTKPEQVLLRRLSVFAGGFTLDAVEAVCTDPPLKQIELLDLLARLVDKSLVISERRAAGTRYRQLETVRQFCIENLDRAGEAAQLSAAHCAYFLAFAVAHNPERATGVVIEQPKLLDREHDNLRSALRWSCAHEPETSLRLAASLWRFWFLRGHAIEGARWVERALAVAPDPTRPRAAALIGLTGLDSRQGRSDRHRALGAEALAIVQQIGQPDEVVMARLVETSLAWGTFDLDEAEQLAADIHAEAVERGKAEHAAASSWLLGQCALSREDGPSAARHLNTCLSELAQSETSAPPFLPVITPSLQLVPIAGRLVPCVEETMLLGRRVGVIQAKGYVLSALGYAARLSADSQSATSVVAEAAEHFAWLGDDLARAQALHQLGCIQRDCGDHSAADEALSLARELRHGLGDRRGELLTELNLALLRAMGDDIDHGLTDARRCLSMFESAGDQVGLGATLTILGAVELISGEVRAAREMYRRAAEKVAPWLRLTGWQRLMVAELSNELGDPHRTTREIDSVAAIFDRTRCVIAGQRLAALRRRGQGGDVEIVLSSR
ncbi:BTAD domain-containing putative transcriptional regulator [Leifsonia sp. YAF41]|uniref:ATP-binding protein n=1 Tax=Leifsonia sp. YAF41 TaxID=3233086 RepID=UPI003F993887